jgi:hypothetical protein
MESVRSVVVVALLLAGCGDDESASSRDGGKPPDAPPLDGGGKPPDAPEVDAGPVTLDLPFAYRFTPDGGLTVQTDGGDLYVSVGPWGAHFQPNTGHMTGNAKSDIMMFFTPDLGPPLIGSNGGPCTPGDMCRLPGDFIRSHLPTYVAPAAGRIDGITILYPEASYAFFQQAFSVNFSAGQYSLTFDVAHIAPSLREEILAATCATSQGCLDVDTWTPGGAVDHLDVRIDVPAGAPIGNPHVRAFQVGNTDFYVGQSGSTAPWASSEIFAYQIPIPPGGGICWFDLIDPAKKVLLQALLENDMLNPSSFRYGMSTNRWQWAAEGLICLAHSSNTDFSALHTGLGGWVKIASEGEDEGFVITPIAKTSRAYVASLYSSASIDFLVARHRPNDGTTTPFNVAVPGMPTVSAQPLIGELISNDGQSLLIRWRDVWPPTSPSPIPELFERAAYILDPATGLKIRWGDGALTADTVPPVSLSASDPCDGTAVFCYDHHKVTTHQF